MIKSFRGLLSQDDQVTIRLSTIRGEIGYRIKKLELLPQNPATEEPESVVKLFQYSQSTVDGEINFANSELLGAGYYSGENTPNYPQDLIVIFDNVTFNQDIFITHKNMNSTTAMNYYLELEQVKLAVDEAAVATLKDMRGSN